MIQKNRNILLWRSNVLFFLFCVVFDVKIKLWLYWFPSFELNKKTFHNGNGQHHIDMPSNVIWFFFLFKRKPFMPLGYVVAIQFIVWEWKGLRFTVKMREQETNMPNEQQKKKEKEMNWMFSSSSFGSSFYYLSFGNI